MRLTCRRLDKLCCLVAGYFPLVFVYAISSWAAYTEAVSISFRTVRGARGAPPNRLLHPARTADSGRQECFRAVWDCGYTPWRCAPTRTRS